MPARRPISLVRSFRNIRLIVLLLLVFAMVQGVVLWRACTHGMQAINSLNREGMPASAVIKSSDVMVAVE